MLFETVILLKSVTALPEIDWVALPLKTTVPVPRLNVPLLAKLPPTLSVAGPLSVPLMVIFAKLVEDEPAMLVVPLKTVVPLLALKVPLFVQFPATFNVPEEAVRILLIVTLLNEQTLEPEIVVLPPNVVVPALAVSVPLFTRLPLTLKLEEGVSEPVIVTLPKVGVVTPLNAVAPEKVTVLDVSKEAELLTKFPFRSSAFALVSNVPAVRVSTPFTTVLPRRVFVFVPENVTLLNVWAPGVIDCAFPLN